MIDKNTKIVFTYYKRITYILLLGIKLITIIFNDAIINNYHYSTIFDNDDYLLNMYE